MFAGTAGPIGRFSPFGSEPNDGVVSVAETRINGACEPIQIPALHTWIMSHPAVHQFLTEVMANSGGNAD